MSVAKTPLEAVFVVRSWERAKLSVPVSREKHSHFRAAAHSLIRLILYE
jgi:hypothetical protein